MSDTPDALSFEIIDTLKGLMRAQDDLNQFEQLQNASADESERAEDAREEFLCLHSRLEELLTAVLSAKDEQALEGVLEQLTFDGEATPINYLRACLQSKAVGVQTDDDELSQALLLPLLVSKDMQVQRIPRELALRLEQSYLDSYSAQGVTHVHVVPRLLSATEVYSLNACDVFELNTRDPAQLRGLLTETFATTYDAVWSPALCFLCLQVRTSLSKSKASVSTQDESLSHSCASELATDLAVLYGTPLIADKLHTVYTARNKGMGLFNKHVGIRSMQRQVNQSDQLPASLMATFHGDPTEKLADELRVAILDSQDEVLAGHVLELTDWFDLEDANKLLEEFCVHFQVANLNVSQVVIESVDDPEAPLFCNGADWFPAPHEELRLESSPF